MVPFSKAVMEISAYEGGSSPLLIFLLIGILFLVAAGIAVFFIWRILRKKQFLKTCKAFGLTPEELGSLNFFMSQFSISDPLSIIEKKRTYNDFSNRLMHQFGSSNITNKELQKEILNLNAIRDKLKMTQSFKTKTLISSRSLPIGQSLEISILDKISNHTMTFNTNIVENNDLFIGIEFPEEKIDEIIKSRKTPPVEISFSRPKDAKYFFDSTVYKRIYFPNSLLYLAHSTILRKGSPQKPLNIHATIIYAGEEGSEEHPANIELLDNNGCTFSFEDNKKLKKNDSVMITTEVEKTALSLHAVITEVIKDKKKKEIYTTSFKNINEDTKKTLLQFVYKQKSKKKKSTKK